MHVATIVFLGEVESDRVVDRDGRKGTVRTKGSDSNGRKMHAKYARKEFPKQRKQKSRHSQ